MLWWRYYQTITDWLVAILGTFLGLLNHLLIVCHCLCCVGVWEWVGGCWLAGWVDGAEDGTVERSVGVRCKTIEVWVRQLVDGFFMVSPASQCPDRCRVGLVVPTDLNRQLVSYHWQEVLGQYSFVRQSFPNGCTPYSLSWWMYTSWISRSGFGRQQSNLMNNVLFLASIWNLEICCMCGLMGPVELLHLNSNVSSSWEHFMKPSGLHHYLITYCFWVLMQFCKLFWRFHRLKFWIHADCSGYFILAAFASRVFSFFVLRYGTPDRR